MTSEQYFEKQLSMPGCASIDELNLIRDALTSNLKARKSDDLVKQVAIVVQEYETRIKSPGAKIMSLKETLRVAIDAKILPPCDVASIEDALKQTSIDNIVTGHPLT
jgi:hypothetical protein